MARTTLTSLALAAILYGVSGCASGGPDLVVDQVNMNWTGGQHQVTSVISNRGGGDAGAFLVYVTPREIPVSQTRRPQISHDVPSLAAGQSVTFNDDFIPLAANENNNLQNVRGIEVVADAKNAIAEGSETNNRQGASPRNPQGLSLTNFNEGLATVLRGLKVSPAAAAQLDMAPGYYRLREFRVFTQTSRRCVTIAVARPYAEFFSGASVLPTSWEPWVFSDIETYDYTQQGWRFRGHDAFGRTLEFDIAFGSPCFTVQSATLEGVAVELSTQTYTTEQLNSCGWTSEPAWTPPSGP